MLKCICHKRVNTKKILQSIILKLPLEYQTKFYINDSFMAQTVDEIIILRAEMCFPVLFGRQFHVLAAEFGKIKFAGKT